MFVPLTLKYPPTAPTGISMIMYLSFTDTEYCLAAITAGLILWPLMPMCTSSSLNWSEEISGSMCQGRYQVIVFGVKETLPVYNHTIS